MQKQPTANNFTKGINSDYADDLKPNDTWVDAMGVRFTDYSNGGLHASTIKGNELEFLLPTGFIPLGNSSYNGVMYIISWNASTREMEIGTYPSPNYTTTGYTRTYKPLQSFTFDNPATIPTDECLPFTAVNTTDWRTKLDLDCKFPLKMQIREDFDGSVNIYWTDYINPIRVINSGFVSATGLSNNRYTTTFQVQSGAINLLNESNFHPVVKLNSLQMGGKLPAGNYFFFVRYTDNNYNSTSFLGLSKVVSVFNKKYVNPPSLVITTFGGAAQEATNQQVVLNISNIDPTVQFLEIGVLYYYSETEYKAYIIDDRKRTNGSTNLTVTVSGNETELPVTIDELTSYKPVDALRCKDMVQINNVLYLGNLAGPKTDHEDLRKLSCAIELEETETKRVLANRQMQQVLNNNVITYGPNEKDVHELVGYKSSEAYQFAIIFVFRGGFVSRPFPVKGYDNMNGTPINPNKSGIFRFSSPTAKPYFVGGVTGSSNGDVIIKGIRFNMQNAAAIFNNSQWIQDNVIGFYFARAERNKNIVCQGLSVRCVDGGTRQNSNNNSNFNYQDKKVMPLMFGCSYNINAQPEIGLKRFASRYSRQGNKRNKIGVFSLDYYLSRELAPEQLHVRKIGNAIFEADFEGGSPSTNNVPFIMDYNLPVIPTYPLTPPSALTGLSCYTQTNLVISPNQADNKSVNIKGFEANPNREFVSKVNEGDLSTDNGFYYRDTDNVSGGNVSVFANLPMALPDYIGIENMPFSGSSDDWDNAIVNLYKVNPDLLDYKQQYDFKNNLFYPISDFITVSDFLNQTKFDCWQGDCFVARSYMKLVHGFTDELRDITLTLLSEEYNNSSYYGDNFTSKFTPLQVLNNGYGHMVNLVLEHDYNPNYRYELGRNYFYPATGQERPGKDFAWLLNSPESFFYNKGYIRILSGRGILGIDSFEPITDNLFKTRIRPSLPHIQGGVRDGYRQFTGSRFDLSYNYGELFALCTLGGVLYSIQESAVNEHPIQERATNTTETGNTVVTAQQIGLTEYRRLLTSEFGTQHRDSVITTNQAIYFIDYVRKEWCRIGQGGVQPLAETKAAKKWLESVLSSQDIRADIQSVLSESYPCAEGILGFYNAQNREVLMTIHLKEQSHTLVFSEMLDAFTSRMPFTPRMYGNIKDDMYSFFQGGYYRHDATVEHNTFYGRIELWYLKFVNNNNKEVLKTWDHIQLNSNNITFKYIKYRTQHQLGIQNPFAGEPWTKPKYNQHAWFLPIRRADQTYNQNLNHYEPKSQMVGFYCEVELGYQDNKPLSLQQVIIFSRLKLIT